MSADDRHKCLAGIGRSNRVLFTGLLTSVALDSVLQAMMVWAPILAKALAVSYPIPVFALVMTATLPDRSVWGTEFCPPI